MIKNQIKMSKAEERAEDFCKSMIAGSSYIKRMAYIQGYHQAEQDIKEELSNLFQEFMLDCIKDDTETHILNFIDVFNNKIKMIGND